MLGERYLGKQAVEGVVVVEDLGHSPEARDRGIVAVHRNLDSGGLGDRNDGAEDLQRALPDFLIGRCSLPHRPVESSLEVVAEEAGSPAPFDPVDGLLQAPVEQVGLEALDAEHGKPVLAAQLGIVGKGVEFRLGAVAAQEGVEGFVVKTVDAFDLQAGSLDDLEAPVETLAAQAAARFPVSGNQRHGDVDAVDSDLLQEAQGLPDVPASRD